jgi:hypothetical protein
MGKEVLCQNFSKRSIRASSLEKERYETVEPASLRKAERAGGVEFEAGGVCGVAAESRFGFQTSPVDFKQIWSDDLP